MLPAELELLLPLLDERARRLVLGLWRGLPGRAGRRRWRRVTGASWQTVADGAAELASGDSAPPGGSAGPGGGRKSWPMPTRG